MRILLISWEYPPYIVGGMGKHVAELLPELSQMTVHNEPIHIDILTTRYNGGESVESVDDQVTVFRVDLPAIDTHDWYNSVIANNEVLIVVARALAVTHKYDLIHVHDWLVGYAGIRLKQEWKTPLLATIHATECGRHQGYLNSYTSRQINHLEWEICFEAWRVIVCSEFMRQELGIFFRTPVDKVDVIPNGIARPALKDIAPEEYQELRRRHAPNGERLLFFVGRMTFEKGVHILIRAMPHILKKHPNTRLIIAGKNSQKMEPLAEKLGVEEMVDFVGFISDPQRDKLYQVVDAAVFPSLYEPFGIVALEAMAHNCNVIVSDVGGLREVVQHERNGLTTFPNDPESIAWAVDRLFASPEEAAQWRVTALADIDRCFRWEKIAQETIQVYQRVHKERQQTAW